MTEQIEQPTAATSDEGRSSLLVGLVKACRPEQWAKNVLVFVAPAAAGDLTKPYYFRLTLVGFVAFCLVASATYLLNDILDVESDRQHPTKHRRPIASGVVPVPLASGLAVVLFLAGVGLAAWNNWQLAGVVAGYAVMTTAYSFWLKTIPVIDLVVLSAGFILRLLGGAYAAHVPVSDWFLIISCFGSLFIAAAKRFAEKKELGDQAAILRPTLGAYSMEYLGLVRAVSAATVLMSYCHVGRRAGPSDPGRQPLVAALDHPVHRGDPAICTAGGSGQGIGTRRGVPPGPADAGHGRAPDDVPVPRDLPVSERSGPASESRLLAGWGRTSPTRSDVISPTDVAEATAAVMESGRRGVVARGLGRGYGDCAQNSGGSVINGPAMSGLVDVDLATHEVRALAGTSLDDLMRWLVPLGMFVPVTPGTRLVTVGGAIAADVHGKNHHIKGSFANHIASFRMIDGTGGLRDISPESEPEVFWATAGGMGLTGVIVDATIRMTPVPTSLLSVDTDRASDLDDVMEMMVEGDARYEYSVAWIDLAAKGRHMGRSILDRGRFASPEQVAAAGVVDLHRYVPKRLPAVPDVFPAGVVNHLTIRAFNEFWYRKSPVRRRRKLMSIEQFFHPLDMVAEWNRVYGRRGFLQYQFLVPDDQAEVVRSVVGRLVADGHAVAARRAEAVRARQPRPPVVPVPRLDAHAGHPGHRRAGPAARRVGRPRRRRRRPDLPGQGQSGQTGAHPGDVPAAGRVA